MECAVKGGTQKESFETSGWKECPDNVDVYRKYSVDETNPRIATKINSGNYCTIIGNTPLPHNKVTSWDIKILKSKDNDGGCIFIGVAPSNINQNEDWNGDKCGWYFSCFIQHCGQDLLTATTVKDMGLGKEEENMFTQETLWVL